MVRRLRSEFTEQGLLYLGNGGGSITFLDTWQNNFQPLFTVNFQSHLVYTNIALFPNTFSYNAGFNIIYAPEPGTWATGLGLLVIVARVVAPKIRAARIA